MDRLELKTGSCCAAIYHVTCYNRLYDTSLESFMNFNVYIEDELGKDFLEMMNKTEDVQVFEKLLEIFNSRVKKFFILYSVWTFFLIFRFL